jgi:protein-tyrosine phosphatase
MPQVLFVCMGNICRSPTAHAVFREQVRERGLIEQFVIDSAGTHDFHIGREPDKRSIETAAEQGLDMTDLRARQVQQVDFEQFDYVVAMDQQNLSALQNSCPEAYLGRLSLLLDWTDGWGTEVPDPYYGGAEGFTHVLEMVTSACGCLLEHMVAEHTLLPPKQ